MDTTNDFYFLTVTLNTTWERWPLLEMFRQSSTDLHKYLRTFMEQYEMYPELTKRGVVHYHLIGKFKDRIKYFKKLNKMVHQFGFIDCQPVKDFAKCYEYISKDKTIMEEMFELPLPLTLRQMEEERKKNIRDTRSAFKEIRTPFDNPNDIIKALTADYT